MFVNDKKGVVVIQNFFLLWLPILVETCTSMEDYFWRKFNYATLLERISSTSSFLVIVYF